MKSKMKRRNRQIEKAKKKQKDSQRAQIHRILDLVMDRNDGGNTTCFYFHGNTHGVEIIMYEGLWKNDPEADYGFMTAFLDRTDIGIPLYGLEAALCGK